MNKLDIYQRYLIVFMIVAFIAYFVILFFFPITIDRNYMPTFVNGITTSISIITGLGGAVIGIVFRGDIDKGDSKARKSYFFAFSVLILPLIYPWGSYIALATDQFELAVRYSLDGYLVALLVIVAVYLLTARTWYSGKKEESEKTDSANPEPTKSEQEVGRQTEKASEKTNKINIAGLLLTIIIALTINVPFAIWNAQQTNRAIDIANENLAIANMMSNFNCDITTVELPAGILYSNSFYPSVGTVESIDSFGQLVVSLKVITPHYSHIAIEVENFIDLEHQGWMNPAKKNQTTVSYVFDEKFEDIIGSGLTQVNATLQLRATVYPDPQQLPPKGNTTQFPLGPLLLKAELYDIQTQKNFTKEFTKLMAISITMPFS
jgi:hypothetical protein